MCKKIGIDLDGVISDFTNNFLRVASRIHKKKFDVSKWTSWDLVECGVMTKKECSEVWEEYIKKNEFANQEPLNLIQAKTYIHKLWKDGFEICYITCRDYKSQGDLTMDWLEKYGFIMKDNCRVVILPLKSDKFLTLNIERYAVAIDDKFETLKQATGVKLRILFDTPHNRLENCDGVVRLCGWNEIYKKIKEEVGE